MNQLQRFIFNKPLVASIIIIIISVGMTFIPINVLFMWINDGQSAEYMAGIVEQTGVSICLIILLKKLHLLEQAGFKNIGKNLWVMWPIVILSVLDTTELWDGTRVLDYTRPMRILLYGLVYLSTGLFEETLCRGVVFNLLLNKWKQKKRGGYLAVIISSLLFGSVHFVHFILGHASLLATMVQVIYASIIGIFFCACVIRMKSIYPAMLMHGLVDITGGLSEIAIGEGINKQYITMSIDGAIGCVIITLPLLIYGLWMIRKEMRKDEVIKSIGM